MAGVDLAGLGRGALRLGELVMRSVRFHTCVCGIRLLYLNVRVADRSLLPRRLYEVVVGDHVLAWLHHLGLEHLLLEVLAVPELVLLDTEAEPLVVVVTH